jgi:drug/metabolite transporter (DMT)-like permease
MWIGTLFALAAGLLWGLVFIGPLLLPDYPPALLSFGRYLAFGIVALPIAWAGRQPLRSLTRADWIEAAKLVLVGNLLYYLFLASAIQRAGAPLVAMIIGTLPVVIAIASNLRDAKRDGRVPWLRLAPSLTLIAAGIACIHHIEFTRVQMAPDGDPRRYAMGAALALGGVACWTWYPLRNADWMRAHADRDPRTWATAQGIATLPLALAGYVGFLVVGRLSEGAWPAPLGAKPWAFAGMMFAMGLLASWVGTLCWNEASKRLPTTVAGQLIVFETLAALGYALVLRGTVPPVLTAVGAGLLVAGVVSAVRTPREE